MTKPRRIILRPKSSRALVLHLHPGRVREAHIRAYRSQLKALSQASEKLRHFREVDQPAFVLWWQEKFAGILLHHLELEKTHEDLLLLADAVELYQQHYGGGYKRAYRGVAEAQDAGRLTELMRKIMNEIEALRPASRSGDAPREAAEKARQKNQRRQDEKPAPDSTKQRDDGTEGRGRRSAPLEAPSDQATRDSYMKRIYHELVLILHPDTRKAGVSSEEQDRLWYELQNAYQWRDLDRIEAIHRALHGEAAQAINFETIPIGDILAMKNAVSEKLGELRQALRLSKKEATWDFEKRRKKAGFLRILAQSIAAELDDHGFQLESRIEKLRRRIEGWSSSKAQRQKGSRRQTPRERYAHD